MISLRSLMTCGATLLLSHAVSAQTPARPAASDAHSSRDGTPTSDAGIRHRPNRTPTCSFASSRQPMAGRATGDVLW